MTVQTASMKSQLKIVSFYGSSLGKKVAMAVTGVMIIGFVIMHLLGNLQIFLGPDKFNAYAAFLASIPGPLWMARIILISALFLHVGTAFLLRKQNRSARPVGYRSMVDIQLTSASKYMLETGVVILLFILMHLAHFTLGVLQPENAQLIDSHGRHDVYQMVVNGFSFGPYFLLYLVAMLALGFHMRHAFWSMFQSLGLYYPEIAPCLKSLSKILGILVALGYSSIPLAVKFGLLH